MRASPRAVLVAAGIGAGLLLALRSSASAASRGSDGTDRGTSEPPEETYARVLIVELSGGGSDAERAGIVWAGRNRERLYGAPASAVVRSLVPRRSEWGSQCGGRAETCAYNAELAAAHEHPRYSAMVGFARRVLEGDIANPIGSRYAFCHPMAADFAVSRARGTADQKARAFELRERASLAPASEAAALYAEANNTERVDSKYRWDPPTLRYLPAWAVAREYGGLAAHPPITIGSTRFS